MRQLRRFARLSIRLLPLLAVGIAFQNFRELEVPIRPADLAPAPGTRATTMNGAAEDFVRTQWMPELRGLEERYAEKLQFHWAEGRADAGEIEMNLLGSTSRLSTAPPDSLQFSVVNDRIRLRILPLEMSCDYQPTRALVSLRTPARTSGQWQFEHSGQDRTSRLSWQMSW